MVLGTVTSDCASDQEELDRDAAQSAELMALDCKEDSHIRIKTEPVTVEYDADAAAAISSHLQDVHRIKETELLTSEVHKSSELHTSEVHKSSELFNSEEHSLSELLTSEVPNSSELLTSEVYESSGLSTSEVHKSSGLSTSEVPDTSEVSFSKSVKSEDCEKMSEYTVQSQQLTDCSLSLLKYYQGTDSQSKENPDSGGPQSSLCQPKAKEVISNCDFGNNIDHILSKETIKLEPVQHIEADIVKRISFKCEEIWTKDVSKFGVGQTAVQCYPEPVPNNADEFDTRVLSSVTGNTEIGSLSSDILSTSGSEVSSRSSATNGLAKPGRETRPLSSIIDLSTAGSVVCSLSSDAIDLSASGSKLYSLPSDAIDLSISGSELLSLPSDANHLPSSKTKTTSDCGTTCTVCGKQLCSFRYLENHMRIHNGDKPFTCSVCGREFSLSQNLKKHQRIHTGEKNYCCPHCFKLFTDSQSMKRHIRLHTGEMPYKCDICAAEFRYREMYVQHMKDHSCQVGQTYRGRPRNSSIQKLENKTAGSGSNNSNTSTVSDNTETAKTGLHVIAEGEETNESCLNVLADSVLKENVSEISQVSKMIVKRKRKPKCNYSTKKPNIGSQSNVGSMEHVNVGSMEHANVGSQSNVGSMEPANVGSMEHANVGSMEHAMSYYHHMQQMQYWAGWQQQFVQNSQRSSGVNQALNLSILKTQGTDDCYKTDTGINTYRVTSVSKQKDSIQNRNSVLEAQYDCSDVKQMSVSKQNRNSVLEAQYDVSDVNQTSVSKQNEIIQNINSVMEAHNDVKHNGHGKLNTPVKRKAASPIDFGSDEVSVQNGCADFVLPSEALDLTVSSQSPAKRDDQVSVASRLKMMIPRDKQEVSDDALSTEPKVPQSDAEKSTLNSILQNIKATVDFLSTSHPGGAHVRPGVLTEQQKYFISRCKNDLIRGGVAGFDSQFPTNRGLPDTQVPVSPSQNCYSPSSVIKKGTRPATYCQEGLHSNGSKNVYNHQYPKDSLANNIQFEKQSKDSACYHSYLQKHKASAQVDFVNCVLCGQNNKKGSLCVCMKSHKIFACDFCGKMFKKSHSRDKHLQLHTCVKPYQCLVCKEMFLYKRELIKHMKNHHLTDSSTSLEKAVESMTSEGSGTANESGMLSEETEESSVMPNSSQTEEKSIFMSNIAEKSGESSLSDVSMKINMMSDSSNKTQESFLVTGSAHRSKSNAVQERYLLNEGIKNSTLKSKNTSEIGVSFSSPTLNSSSAQLILKFRNNREIDEVVSFECTQNACDEVNPLKSNSFEVPCKASYCEYPDSAPSNGSNLQKSIDVGVRKKSRIHTCPMKSTTIESGGSLDLQLVNNETGIEHNIQNNDDIYVYSDIAAEPSYQENSLSSCLPEYDNDQSACKKRRDYQNCPEKQKPYCMICESEFDTKELFDKHLNKHRGFIQNSESNICRECGEVFDSESEFQNHMNMHDQEGLS